ncbi:MAG: hypothetical protein QW279_00960 [Candidatus Jordarchaeaceae archaeon]
MIRRSKLIAIIFALAFLLLLVMSPLLVASSVTHNITGYSSNSLMDTSSWFDENHGQLFSNKITLELLPANFGFSPSGIFSFRQDNQKTVEFGVYYSRIIEFNDTNGNKMFDVGESIRNVSLDNFIWTHQKLNLSSGEVILPLIGIKPPISIVFWLHLYLATKNVTLSNEYSYLNFTVLGELSVKAFIMINGFDWTPNNGSLPTDSRMLALEMVLRSEVMPWNQKHLFQLSNGSRFNSTHSMNETRSIPPISGYESMISLVTPNNVTHGELRWFNKAITNGELKNLSASFITNGTSFNLYLSVPYYGSDTLFLDPSFSMQNAPSGGWQESLVLLVLLFFILLYPYTPSTGLLTLSFLMVSVATLIIVAVYYLRRKNFSNTIHFFS